MSRLVCILIGSAFFSQVSAQRLPEWELGLAAGYATLPYYRGAATGRDILLPLPLAIFRGEKYNKTRRTLFGFKRISIDLSLSAVLPVPEGKQAPAREGMPGLDATLELGPSVSIQLWKRTRHQFAAVFPLRLVSSVSFSSFAQRGWVFSPFVAYAYEDKGLNGWKFDILAGPLYGSKKYHDFYYSVDRAYVTSSRYFFEANQGYSGSRVAIYVKKSYKRLWLSVFARYDMLSSAVFEQSPLVEKNNSLIGGFVLGWVFEKSPKMVRIEG